MSDKKKKEPVKKAEKKVEPEKKPPTALQRIENLEELTAQLQAEVPNAHNIATTAYQKVNALEGALAGVAKTLAALTKELKELGVVREDGIMSRIRELDDENDMKQFLDIKQSGMVEKKQKVTETSLVMAKATMIDTVKGETKVLRQSTMLDLSLMPSENPMKSVMLGKKVGDIVDAATLAKGKKMIFSIMEVYDMKEGPIVPGETQDEASPEQNSKPSH